MVVLSVKIKTNEELAEAVRHARQVFRNRAAGRRFFPTLKPRQRLQYLQLTLQTLATLRQIERSLIDGEIQMEGQGTVTQGDLVISPMPPALPRTMPEPRMYLPEPTDG